MQEKKQDYRGWKITIKEEDTLCAHFSFSITSPIGKTQKVSMGGDNARRALERAREMIDMEEEFAAEG